MDDVRRETVARAAARSALAVLAVLAALAVLGLAGCSGEGRTVPSEPRATTEPTTSGEPTDAPTPLGDLTVGLETVAEGLAQPVFVANAGDGSERLFVVEQEGTVRVIRAGELVAQPFLDIRHLVSSGGERGLLGLAFAPDYEESGRFYVNYTDTDGDTVVARYTADDPSSSTPSLEGPEPVFTARQPYANHNGGCIVFAPDGTLWVGMGDGGSAGDPEARAQDPEQVLGKMLSLDVEGGSSSPRSRIVQQGLRNPWRFSFDRETDDMWIGDVGQNAAEEIDFVPFDEAVGANFGWDLWEGNDPYPPGADSPRDDFVFPVIAYGRDVGGSVTGGYVYRGSDYPDLAGVYFYGDYVAGWIAAARRVGGGVDTRTVLPDPGIVPSSFGEGEDGELYVCDYNGAVLKVTAE